MASTDRNGAVVLAFVGSTIDEVIRFARSALRLKEQPTRSTVRKRIAIHGQTLHIEANLIPLAKFSAQCITKCDGVLLIAERSEGIVFDEFCSAMGVCYNAGLPARLILMLSQSSGAPSAADLVQTRQILRAAESFTIATFAIDAQKMDLAQACLASLVTFVLTSTDSSPFQTQLSQSGVSGSGNLISEGARILKGSSSGGSRTGTKSDLREASDKGSHMQDSGCSITDLVELVVHGPPTASQQRSCDNLLCMYRKFADPCDLLTAIKIVFLAPGECDLQLYRAKRQLRCLEILHNWVATYPADFADSVVREQLGRMLKQLLNHPIYSSTVAAITHAIMPERCDIDREWAFSRAKRLSTLGTSTQMLKHTSSSRFRSDMLDLLGPGVYAEHEQEFQVTNPKRSDAERSSTLYGRDALSSRSLIAKYIGLEIEDSAVRGPLTKLVWRQIRDFEPSDLAMEITRIDAALLCHLEPRELIRHVSLTVIQAEESSNLINVKLMVFWFSRLASWVSNIIVFRDKAQDRADVMRRLIDLAWRLRRLNNYFSLAAVIAGLIGHNVYRLSQTRSLISPDDEKRLRQLEVLMNSSKGNAAYRLAWQNSSGPRIPYFLMHRRDLLIIEETNTFINSDSQRINWAKFEKMGDIVAETLQSKGEKYKLGSLNGKVYEWIFLYELQDDDALYLRSREIERGLSD